MACSFLSILPQIFKTISYSAIFCTSGEQAAKRAAEGFDMVGVSISISASS